MKKYVEELKMKIRFSEFVMVIPPPDYIADDAENESCCDVEELDNTEMEVGVTFYGRHTALVKMQNKTRNVVPHICPPDFDL